jgi:hypothetical protein
MFIQILKVATNPMSSMIMKATIIIPYLMIVTIMTALRIIIAATFQLPIVPRMTAIP